MARKQGTRNKNGEGSPWYDRKNKRYVYTLEHKGRRYRVYHKDKTEARVRFEQLRSQVLKDMDVDGARTLLRDYLPWYIDTEVGGKQSTRDDYHKRADLYILPTLGELATGTIKRKQIVAWVNGMVNEPNEKGVYWSRNSIKQALSLLRRSLDALVPESLEHNPAAGVKVPLRRRGDEYKIDAEPSEAKVFTADQCQVFLAEVKRTDHLHGLYVYFVLLAELGLRRGEGLGLRVKDIDAENLTIRIAQQVIRNTQTNEKRITTPKTDEGERDLPATDWLIQLLLEHCKRGGATKPTDLVFPGRDGKERQPNSVTQLFRRICRRLGYDGYTLHSLRKHAITNWRTDGVDLEVVSALAGHKSIKVTAEVYSQATMDRKRAAIEKGGKPA